MLILPPTSDLSDFDHGMIVGASQGVFRSSETGIFTQSSL